MTNGTKILIGIVAVVTITLGIIMGINKNKSKETGNKIQENKTIIDEYLNENNEIEDTNTVENEASNEVQNTVNETNTTVQNENINTTSNSSNTASSSNQALGQEEQESQKENTNVNNEETAIELAKQEWGIDVDSYSFEPKLTGDGIYEITVRSNDSNRTTVAIYTVNIKTGTVTE